LDVYFIRVSAIAQRVDAFGSGGRDVTVSSANSPSPVEVGPDERRQLTVAFADLVGSTALASAMDPEDWHDVLDSYQHRVADIVKAHGGMVSQFQGDGAVLYFGYPVAVESASRDAVDFGLAIVEEVAALTRELPPELTLSDLQTRVGIHTGEVVVAAVRAGGNDRPPDVWGQVPHLASRLQGEAKPGQVMISGDTADLVRGYFDLESLGPRELKGIPAPTPVYRVVRRRAARHRLEAKPLADFVPRPAAADWLDEQWARVTGSGGTSRLVVLSGEPGIGKSRQVLEFARDLEGRGHPVRTVYCSRRESLSPLHPFDVVMGETPATPMAAAGWADELAAEGPALLVVEDGHWADPSTLEAAHLVARGEHPTLVLMTTRPELVEDPTLRPDAHHALGGLNPEAARDLLGRLPGSSGLSPGVREALVARAEGVPLFLEELVRSVAEHEPDSTVPMPTSIIEVITARLDRLGEAKQVAQSASVIGRSFERPVLAAVADIPEACLEANLSSLIDHAIVEPVEGKLDALQFRHALFHEASYRSVMRPDRVRIHGAVGSMYLESGLAETRPEIAAFHLGAAGRADEAVPLWQKASRNARKNARFREAAGHEREVLRLVPQLPEDERDRTELKSRSRLMICLTAVDQGHPETPAEAERVEELARKLGDRGTLLRNYIVMVPWWQASAAYDRINEILGKARQVAEALDEVWFLNVIAMFDGTVRIWQGDVATGLERMRVAFAEGGLPLEESLASLPSVQSVELLALVAPRVATALACWLTGEVELARQVAEDALALARARAVPQAMAVVAVTFAVMAQLDGDRDLVVELCREACDLSDEVSTRQWRQWARSLLWWAGEGDEEPEVPGPLLRPYFLMVLAQDQRVDPDRAMALLADAGATMVASGERFSEPALLRVRGALCARSGRHAAAARCYQLAIALARVQGSRMLELQSLTEWTQLDVAPPRVRRELEALVAELGPGGQSLSLEAARAVLAAGDDGAVTGSPVTPAR
jgi:class 3 adenylate cyclase